MNETNEKNINIESLIEENGFYSFFPKGTSMLPLIRQGRDSAIVEKPQGRLKKYDIALYKRKNGMYVLHRVVRVKKDGYVMCGDNQCDYEHGITDANIVGVLSELYRDGEKFDLNSPIYKFKVTLRVFIQPPRLLRRKIIYFIKGKK